MKKRLNAAPLWPKQTTSSEQLRLLLLPFSGLEFQHLFVFRLRFRHGLIHKREVIWIHERPLLSDKEQRFLDVQIFQPSAENDAAKRIKALIRWSLTAAHLNGPTSSKRNLLLSSDSTRNQPNPHSFHHCYLATTIIIIMIKKTRRRGVLCFASSSFSGTFLFFSLLRFLFLLETGVFSFL